VVAPGSVEDCFYEIVHAFNLAEHYQMPVIFLSDQSLSHRTESLEMPDLSRLTVVDRERPRESDLKPYWRFRVTENGVSPMALPGVDAEGAYVAPGLEHGESGHPDQEPSVHELMTQKRFRKLTAVQSELGPVPRYGSEKPKVGIIGWGATEGSIREAVERSLAAGYEVAALHPRVLNPLPEKELGAFIDSVEHVIVPEVNYQGQMAHHLAATFGFRPIPLNKYGGLPFAPGEIFRKVEEVLDHGH
jgi:2-oxoglutarate ferredoxin oxidoreductase subunit alpha